MPHVLSDLSQSEAAALWTAVGVVLTALIGAAGKVALDWLNTRYKHQTETDKTTLAEWRNYAREQERRTGRLEKKAEEQAEEIRRLWVAEQDCRRDYYRAVVWLRHCEELLHRAGHKFESFDPGNGIDRPQTDAGEADGD